MVDGLKPTAISGLEVARGKPQQAPAQALTRPSAIARAAAAGKTPNPAADLAAWGPIVDVERVTQLRQEIASGLYKADPAKIADKMLALDLPASEDRA